MSALLGTTVLDTAIAAAPVVAVIRHTDAPSAERIARAAIEGGIRVVEITFTVPGADALIARLRADRPDVVIGAGTVLTPDQLDAAADAGAVFAVAPILDEAVAARAAERAVAFIPGAFTPTEVARASRGAAAVKLFPAAGLGTAFVTAVRDVLPDVRLMPTGGITAAAVGDWLRAGAYAVGLAGALGTAWRAGGAADVQNTARIAVAAATAERNPA